jgi:hypothetical protein
MNKQERIKWILLVLIFILLTFILLQQSFFVYHFSKQDEMYKGYFNEIGDNLIKINRLWIQYYRGEINITNQQIIKIETALDRLENDK